MIKLDLPPSINAIYKTTRTGGFYKSEKAKEWEKTAGYQVLASKPPSRRPYDLVGPIYLGIDMYFARDRDIDSSIKILCDLLQKMRVYENDSQIIHLNVRKYKVKKGEEHVELDVHEAIV